MRCSLCSGAVFGLLILMAGCAQAPPPPPPDTRAADEKSIRDGEVAWNADWAAKDVDKIASSLRRRRDPDGPRYALDEGEGRHSDGAEGIYRGPKPVVELHDCFGRSRE